MKLIECVPNFSEGRNKNFINDIKSIVNSSDHVHLLDIDPGADTNRTVLTFVGKPENVVETAFNLIKYSSTVIDMSTQKGEHPRMGATDVCPLIPLQNVTMNECIELSKKLGKRVWEELSIPVFLYENSASSKERKNLSNIRNGQYEGMKSKIKQKQWYADYGLSNFNIKSGVTAIGAREFLIAYNININTTDKKIATDIALDIREAGRLKRDKNGIILRDSNGKGIKKPGKFKYCKAVGWYIDEYKQAQVSINLTDYTKTTIYKVFEEVRKQARKRGFRVTGSEIVGLVPKKALIDTGTYYLKDQGKSIGIPENDILDVAIKSLGLSDIDYFDISNKIIENSIKSTSTTLLNSKINDFANELSRNSYAPGGGSVAALVGLMGSSLSCMVSNLTFENKKFSLHKEKHFKASFNLQNLSNELSLLIDQDTNAYKKIISARRLPKKTKDQIIKRDKALLNATILAIETPHKVLELCLKVHKIIFKVINFINMNCISDIGAANNCILSSSKSAYLNILINLGDINKNQQNKYKESAKYYIKQVDNYYLQINKIVDKELGLSND